MFKKISSAFALAVFLAVGLDGPTDAAWMGMPKAMIGPVDGASQNFHLWSSKSYSLLCVENPGECRASQLNKVALFSLPKTLKHQVDQVPLDTPTLAPMAHTMFCLRYPKDCQVRRIAFRGGTYDLTPGRWNELRQINAKVNRRIRPEANLEGLAGEKWIINPVSGDCNDYAVSKQHELLAHGWPSRTLLLAEVATSWGEHHLVLVVRTGAGDFILDNLNPTVRPWSRAGYRWVRMQSPRNPKFWWSVRSLGV